MTRFLVLLTLGCLPFFGTLSLPSIVWGHSNVGHGNGSEGRLDLDQRRLGGCQIIILSALYGLRHRMGLPVPLNWQPLSYFTDRTPSLLMNLPPISHHESLSLPATLVKAVSEAVHRGVTKAEIAELEDYLANAPWLEREDLSYLESWLKRRFGDNRAVLFFQNAYLSLLFLKQTDSEAALRSAFLLLQRVKVDFDYRDDSREDSFHGDIARIVLEASAPSAIEKLLDVLRSIPEKERRAFLSLRTQYEGKSEGILFTLLRRYSELRAPGESDPTTEQSLRRVDQDNQDIDQDKQDIDQDIAYLLEEEVMGRLLKAKKDINWASWWIPDAQKAVDFAINYFKSGDKRLLQRRFAVLREKYRLSREDFLAAIGDIVDGRKISEPLEALLKRGNGKVEIGNLSFEFGRKRIYTVSEEAKSMSADQPHSQRFQVDGESSLTLTVYGPFHQIQEKLKIILAFASWHNVVVIIDDVSAERANSALTSLGLSTEYVAGPFAIKSSFISSSRISWSRK